MASCRLSAHDRAAVALTARLLRAMAARRRQQAAADPCPHVALRLAAADDGAAARCEAMVAERAPAGSETPWGPERPPPVRNPEKSPLAPEVEIATPGASHTD